MKKITKSQMNAYTKSCKQNAEIILNLPDDKTAVVTVDTAPNIAVAQEIIDQTVRMTLENGEYHPERLPYVFFALVLNYLTNIDVPATPDKELSEFRMFSIRCAKSSDALPDSLKL